MEIKVGATDDGNFNSNPPPLPSFSFSLLPNQPLNVGRLVNFRQSNDIMLGGTLGLNTEAVYEKAMIKEEFLKYGNLNRRRELENEAIAELILERGLTMRHPEGVSLINAPLLSLQTGLCSLASSWLESGALDGRPVLVNQNNGGTDARLSLGNVPDGKISDGLPFQRQPGGTSGVSHKPVIDLRKVVPLPKTATSEALAGSKRMFETPMMDGDDGAAVASKSKKSQPGWSCELCQVRVTSEQGLKDHLKGKKHKSKEKTVKKTTTFVSNHPNKSESPKETDKSGELAVCGNEDVNNMEVSSPKKPHAESNGGFGLEEKQNAEEFKNVDTDFKFWCKMCEVGTTDEESMTAHRTGNKHMSLLKEKGGGVITIKTMPDDFQYADLSRNDTANQEKEVSLNKIDEQEGEVEANELETTEKCILEAF